MRFDPRSPRPHEGRRWRLRRASLLATMVALATFGVASAPAFAQAVIPTTSGPGTSPNEITNYQAVTFGPSDDGTWPCGPSDVSGPVPCPGPDGETGPTLYPLGFNINFFGTEYSGVYINTNGNITFTEPLSQFTPSDLTDFPSPIIAPFFADVDTRGGGALVDFGQGTLNGKQVFVVNWPGVGCYDENASVLDNFQLILIDRADRNTGPNGDDFDIEFNYDTIEWDTGQASGGDANCLVGDEGGTSAYVGYTNGTATPGDSYELPGSGEAGSFLDGSPGGLIDNSVNSAVLGRYVFTVVNGQPTQPTSLTTSLSGADQSGASIAVPPGTAVTDAATLSGENAGDATGSVTYNVYSDPNCTMQVGSSDTETILEQGVMPPSQPVTLNDPGTYYWQVSYSGDDENDGSVSACGSETETVPGPTDVSTSLSGADESGATIGVPPGTAVTDTATLSGANASTAGGTVTYSVYSDAACTVPAAASDTVDVTDGSVPASDPVTLATKGTYYWVATYSGDAGDDSGQSSCGSEVESVPGKADLEVTLSVPSPQTDGSTFDTGLTVDNVGPDTAGMVYAAMWVPSPLTITDTAGAMQYGHFLVWSLGSLDSGADASLVPAVQAPASGSGWTLIPAAALSFNTPDPHYLNNIAFAAVKHEPAPGVNGGFVRPGQGRAAELRLLAWLRSYMSTHATRR